MKKFLKNNKNLIGLFIVLVILGIITLILLRNSGIHKANMRRIMGKYESGEYYISLGNDARIWLNLPGCTVPESEWLLVEDNVILIKVSCGDEALVAEFEGDTAKVFEAVHTGREEDGDWIYDYDPEDPFCILTKKKK